MAKMVTARWKQSLREQGASGDDVRIYTEAFEHLEIETALKLG